MDTVIDIVRGLFAQLQKNAAGHIVMGLVLGFYTFFVVFLMMVPFFALPFVLQGDPDSAGIALAGTGIVTVLCVLIAMLPYLALYFGYIRASVREAEGGAPVTFGQVMADAKDCAGRVIVTELLAGLAEGFGALFCYVPGLIAGFFFSTAGPLAAVGGRTATEALGEAARNTRAAPGKYLAVYVGYVFCVLVASWLPLIGMFASPVVGVVYRARALRVLYPGVGTPLLEDGAAITPA